MNLYPKKSLGQHFLQSRSALVAMCDAGEVQTGDVVLEIGPGKGALTAELLARGARVVAVEKDRSLIPMLEVCFDKEITSGQLLLVEGDALEIEAVDVISGLVLPPLLAKERAGGDVNGLGMLILEPRLEPKFTSPQPSPNLGEGAEQEQRSFKIIANIPYYITGALLERFLSAPTQPTVLVFLVQKEVAERIARSKKESILSISVKVYGEPKYIKTVPAGAFSPPPKIDSAIFAVKDISRKNFKSTKHERQFFTLLRAGFSHKRKLLSSNLKPILGEQTETLLAKADIPLKSRAEDVALEKWLILSE